ncbi:hypothetical protein Nepgr_014145 [Nepenthes gracilis]|uniref:Uncharacterized protein n=1 Tax=Nepenthes gracilis TaxID=150966 RepID=A0AAD3SKC3_NEPGR|nr:hypothetical protein Nepgr_014145 [Nepenthes gracilis]
MYYRLPTSSVVKKEKVGGVSAGPSSCAVNLSTNVVSYLVRTTASSTPFLLLQPIPWRFLSSISAVIFDLGF